MLRVLFFAGIREQLGCSERELAWREGLDLDGVQRQLCAAGGERWRQALEQDNTIRAVNQVVARDNIPLRDGDEVAFYPPVTGG